MAIKISVGCDPEVVLRHKGTGEYVSAHNLLPGTKDKPHPVKLGAVQVDGVAAEFNTLPALKNSEFIQNIGSVMSELQTMVGPDYELVSEPAVLFKEDYFKSLPDHVKELGCNPDWDAYTGQISEKPDGSKTTMRTFAGHIHIGWRESGDPTDETHMSDCRIIAKNLDYYLGLYSLQWDKDTDRRKLYGKAGCFRPKSYGIEYRPLSNVWLRTPGLQSWVFDAARSCMIQLMVNGKRADEFFGEIAKDFINNSESWWTPEDAKKSKDHNRLFQNMSLQLDMKAPPALPKPMDTKVVTKANPKHKFDAKLKASTITDDVDLRIKEGKKLAAADGSTAWWQYVPTTVTNG